MSNEWSEVFPMAGGILVVLLVLMALYQRSVKRQKRWMTSSPSLVVVLVKFGLACLGAAFWAVIMGAVALSLFQMAGGFR